MVATESDYSKLPSLFRVYFSCKTEKSQKRKTEHQTRDRNTAALLVLNSLHKAFTTVSFAFLKSKMVGYFIFSVFDLIERSCHVPL